MSLSVIENLAFLRPALRQFGVRHPLAAVREARRTRPQRTDMLSFHVEQLRGQPEKFLDNLWTIGRDPQRCGGLAAQSYWHRNGFAKIRLGEWAGYTLRLHIWPDGEDRRGDMNPHGHRWNFASWLLTGEGITETYYRETFGDHKDASLYVRSSYGRKNGADYLNHYRIAYLRAIAEHKRTTGVYTCDTDVIHTVDPVGCGFMATVVLQSKIVCRTTHVYLKHDGRDEAEQHRRITAHELSRLLGDLIDAMGSAPRN